MRQVLMVDEQDEIQEVRTFYMNKIPLQRPTRAGDTPVDISDRPLSKTDLSRALRDRWRIRHANGRVVRIDRPDPSPPPIPNREDSDG